MTLDSAALAAPNSEEDPLAFFGGLIERPRPAIARFADGSATIVPIDRYLGPLSGSEEAIAADCEGPVLDVGCGPGRLLDAFDRRGTWALGLDRSPAAVEYGRRRGRRMLLGDIFGPVPRAGEWKTLVLLDGNIGIGGDPERLLRRARDLLAEGGRIVAEVHPPGVQVGPSLVRLESGSRASAWFEWATVGADSVCDTASGAGLRLIETAPVGERWFAYLK